MRGNHNAAAGFSEGCEILERANVIGAIGEIEQQNVAAFDRPFDTRHENDSALACVGRYVRIAQVVIVKREGESVESELDCSIDQLFRVVVDDVHRIF